MIQWIKTHKLILVLAVVVLYLLKDRLVPELSFIPRSRMDFSGRASLPSEEISLKRPALGALPDQSGFSIPNTSDRVIIQESNLSLLVQDVRKIGDEIISYAKGVSGHMVSSSYSRPEESPYAVVTVRVSTEKLDEALTYFRSLAIKVTSENLRGTDVTEEYTDLDARLTTLRTTQSKFNEILAKATQVQDILTVQRELITLQDQIDRVIGQKQAIEKNAALTKATIYLASDELALPYVPDQAFRPALIFKQAVRSMVAAIRFVGAALIWVGVYAVIWVPLLLGYLGYRWWRTTRTS